MTQNTTQKKGDMAVMLTPKRPLTKLGRFQLRPWHGLLLAMICVFTTTMGYATSVPGVDPAPVDSIPTVMMRWMPLLLEGFMFNILISVLSMAVGTAIGTLLGLGQISLLGSVRRSSWFVTQFFRNAPWLVLLFFAMFLLPFEFDILGVTFPFPDWVKAIIGLSLPVMANVSEIVRGAVLSLPSGQWEAAESLAYTRRQTLWLVILPQCVKRMLPPWMNLYSILTMATVLASVVGVSEVMTLTGRVLSAEGGRSDLLAPFYSFILLLFFIYCYPIARWTVYLESKFAVKG
jgi:polar amino acid transport system permease protein